MKKILLITALFTSLFRVSLAQTDKLDKKLDKANDLINQDKMDDADKYLQKLVTKHPEYGKGWDLLAEVRYKEYDESKQSDNVFSNVVVTTTSKNGKDTVKNDTLATKLMSLLSQIKPSKIAFNKFLYTVREGTLMSNEAFFCNFYLRHYYVDIDIDSNIGGKALDYFNQAEAAFSSRDYDKAATLYKQALSVQPNYYKANMYLGDAYYFSGLYPKAQKIFEGCVTKYPFLLEPRKYLIDDYAKQGFYSKAYTASVDAMAVYPDLTVVEKLNDAATLINKKVNITWTPRPIFPIQIITDTNVDLNGYAPDKPLVAKGPWKYYVAALDKIKSYCNDKGIIVKSNSLTQSHYMEVYAWEEMLKNSNDRSLDEARQMQKDGFLDCYVLVTCFHQDFYNQYKDFASKNQAKISQYYNKYTN